MRLLSASEDLALRTLRHINGAVRRLLYLVTLRDEGGNYRHWGMAQEFGDEAVRIAAADAHREALNEVLRKPIRELWNELAATESDRDAARQQLEELARLGRNLIPPGCTAPAECHLSSVLLALRELAKVRPGTSNRPVA